MAAINWTNARDLLDAVLPAGDTHPVRVRGLALEARLDALGAIYDAVFTGDASTAKDSADAEYSSDAADRVALLQSLAGIVDHAAQVVEALQIAAQSGPFRYRGLSGKNAYTLAPDVSIPWDGTGGASATAQLELLDGVTPVLVLVAKDAGTWGNTVEASVSVTPGGTTTVWSTGSGAAGTFGVATATAGTVVEYDLDATPKVTALRKVAPETVHLLVRRGDYSERYELRQGQAVTGLRESLLLASAEWASPTSTLPDALTWTALAGGSGGAIDAAKARAALAQKLAEGAAYKDTLKALVSDLDSIVSSTVPYPSGTDVFVYTGKPVATEFEDAGTTYLVVGVNKGLPASMLPRELSVLQLETRLLVLVEEARALRESLT